jgi:hypothetical protein
MLGILRAARCAASIFRAENCLTLEIQSAGSTETLATMCQNIWSHVAVDISLLVQLQCNHVYLWIIETQTDLACVA